MIGYHPFTVFFGVCPQCQTMCQVDNVGKGIVCLPHDVCGDRKNGQCDGSINTAPQVVFEPKDMMEADRILDIGTEVGRRYAGGKIEKYVDDLLNFMEGKECFAQQMTCILDFKLRMDIKAYDTSTVEESYWKFLTYVPGSGAECLSGTEEYVSSGTTLEEAKAKLVKEVGCTKDFFDEPEHTKITPISRSEYETFNSK